MTWHAALTFGLCFKATSECSRGGGVRVVRCVIGKERLEGRESQFEDCYAVARNCKAEEIVM